MLAPVACSAQSISQSSTVGLEEKDSPDIARRIETADLISVRDIGSKAVSPNGLRIAFKVQQKVVKTNDYKSGWYVLSLHGAASAVFVGEAGDVVFANEETGLLSGVIDAVRPVWSPDSEWIVYRLRKDGEVQLWRSRYDGSVQEQLTHNEADVIDYKWSTHGDGLLFTVGQNRIDHRANQETEAANGYLFDNRFVVGYDVAPAFRSATRAGIFAQPEAPAVWVLEWDISAERPATPEEEGEFGSLGSIALPDNDERSLLSSVVEPDSGRVAWLENEKPSTNAGYRAPLTVFGQNTQRVAVRCSKPECHGQLESLAWAPNGEDVFFIRRDGPNYLRRKLLAWTPDTGHLRVLAETDDLITDCERAVSTLVCLHEGWTSPRTIIDVDPATGIIRILFDPNPNFQDLQFTRVEKLSWRGKSGRSAAGHLVYPVGYEQGTQYPLVIVQYRSRGFLRGGVGDEYPIHPLAAQGFFVLSFERPEKHDVNERIGDPWELEKHYWGKDFWEKSSALAALESMIDELTKQSLVDPDRVGITGLSDGAETLWFAMIHSDKFAAAAASDGSWSPSWYYLVNAEIRANYFAKAAELPAPASGDLLRWRQISAEFHADTIDTPILLQVADHELVHSAASIGALQDAGQPIEAYVFPDEYHIKWQPKHKLVVYNRTIDWFNFWLRDVEDPDREKAEQYARWRKLRAEHCDALETESQDDLPTYCEAE